MKTESEQNIHLKRFNNHFSVLQMVDSGSIYLRNEWKYPEYRYNDIGQMVLSFFMPKLLMLVIFFGHMPDRENVILSLFHHDVM